MKVVIDGVEYVPAREYEPLKLVPDGGIAASVRRDTAKAVLDRVRSTYPWTDEGWEANVDRIAREFGVDEAETRA